MQEPIRNNLLKVMLKNFSSANRTTFVHRIVCIGKDSSGFLQTAMESIANEFIEGKKDSNFKGLGLFYNPYVINIIESSEDTINKYLDNIMKLIKPNANLELKVLVFVPHIGKVYFPNWSGKIVRPPVLLKNLQIASEKSQHLEMAKLCLGKLYRISVFIHSQPPGQYHTTLQNLSKTCQQDIPETQLLDFLISSPLLIPVSKYLEHISVPPWKSLQETVWPVPQVYVPYNIVAINPVEVLVEGKIDKEENQKECIVVS